MYRGLKGQRFSLLIVCLGITAIILENAHLEGTLVNSLTHIIDFSVSILFISDILRRFFRSREKAVFLKKNLLELVFVLAFIGVVLGFKLYYFFIDRFTGHNMPVKAIVLISAFNVFKTVIRIKKLNYFFSNLTKHPAQTIMVSFLAIILLGTILLMMPFSVSDRSTLGFVNALFTSTSATCVTGLIVVDTATRFSSFGKFVIMSLIQIGGLGIMILAYFTAYIIGRKLTYSDKMALSYMIDEDDARNLGRGVKNIVNITFIFEITGAAFLYAAFAPDKGFGISNVFYSFFHSISAFCNAGFALFTDNLCSFKTSPLMNFTIAGLIISGGISFMVLGNTFRHIRSMFRHNVLRRSQRVEKLTLNTKVVLFVTAALLITGTLLIYKFEHRENLIRFSLGSEYLMAFFQTVTLRTAGFNTMDISALHTATYALMIFFMYIGGASGSCAGGIKVNTLGVVWGYIRSIFNNEDDVVLLKHMISKDLINQAFLVMFLALSLVFGGALLLALIEKQAFIKIIFEATSAFATVGLSTGITPLLSVPGKLIIVILMFIGRLGPLTVVTALSQKVNRGHIKYPEGKISIG